MLTLRGRSIDVPHRHPRRCAQRCVTRRKPHDGHAERRERDAKRARQARRPCPCGDDERTSFVRAAIGTNLHAIGCFRPLNDALALMDISAVRARNRERSAAGSSALAAFATLHCNAQTSAEHVTPTDPAGMPKVQGMHSSPSLP